MASTVLHIKDAYYFEVPKLLWPSHRPSKAAFPDVWVKLDPDFQLWEAERLRAALAGRIEDVPNWADLKQQYLAWTREDHNVGKPLDVMLEQRYAEARLAYEQEFLGGRAETANAPSAVPAFDAYVQDTQPPAAWFIRHLAQPAFASRWAEIKQQAGDVAAYKTLDEEKWAPAKIDGYNQSLSGKILIPQPFGELRNLYEPESGFCISKFLIIQVAVAVVLLVVFGRLAKRVSAGEPPRGPLANLLEIFLVYIRDSIARPAIGAHDGDKFVPLLWTMFMFILVCNLCGLLPWVGAPTASFSVTTALAFVTFSTGVLGGMKKFGPLGFIANQIPSMDLAWPMAIFIKPMLLAIELLGLCIKHLVLGIRLLANMVAGHLVLLGVMGLAFGAAAATQFHDAPVWQWSLTALISIVASTLFSCLELFVAFLQAYIFTFLSALFIGAATHHH
jgi:F-type H+-transporting ATPase subunit a